MDADELENSSYTVAQPDLADDDNVLPSLAVSLRVSRQ